MMPKWNFSWKTGPRYSYSCRLSNISNFSHGPVPPYQVASVIKDTRCYPGVLSLNDVRIRHQRSAHVHRTCLSLLTKILSIFRLKTPRRTLGFSIADTVTPSFQPNRPNTPRTWPRWPCVGGEVYVQPSTIDFSRPNFQKLNFCWSWILLENLFWDLL